jgi:hypothetical protein
MSEIAPAALAGAALVALAFSHWLQMPEPAMTAMVGVLGSWAAVLREPLA